MTMLSASLSVITVLTFDCSYKKDKNNKHNNGNVNETNVTDEISTSEQNVCLGLSTTV